MAAPFDATKPNVARMYDYWLGGKDNFPADRRAADAVRELRPNVAAQALDNKRFQTRAVRYVAGQGVRQFIDVGSGLPTSPVTADGQPPSWLATHEAATHEAATAGTAGPVAADPMTADPEPLVAYIDNDPVAVLHSRALLTGGRDGIVAVEADMRDPGGILAHEDIREAGFDIGAPACVILACVLHFVDAATARGIMTAFARALAPGSYVIASVGYAKDEGGADFARTYNAQQGPQIFAHTWEQITGFFDGLELLPPGIADTAYWPLRAPTERASMIVGGIARRT